MSDTQLKKGYFENEGLDLTIKEYGSGKAATESILNGEVDISTVADMPVVFNSFSREDFCIISTFASSYDSIKYLRNFVNII